MVDGPNRIGGADDEVLRLGREAERLARQLPAPLRRIRVASGESHVEVEWAAEPGGAPVLAGSTPGAAPVEPAPDPGHLHVVAPMVGTFYHAPSPDAPPYVSIGDVVEPDTVVGIVEAMKLMNEITAGLAGVVAAVLVGNAEMVEFGQPLLVLDALPDGG